MANSSSVHPKARIDSNVKIGPYCIIEEDVEIGSGTSIEAHAILMNGTRIGKNCAIYPGAIIGSDPQHLRFPIQEKTFVEIGDHTTIREYVTINRGTTDRVTTIGQHVYIMAHTHIGHDCRINDRCVIANYTGLAGHVVLQAYVTIGGFVAIQQFCMVGTSSFIAARSNVRTNVPPYIKVAHDPLRYISINKIGLVRREMSSEAIQEIDRIYKILYDKQYNTSQAIQVIEERIDKGPEKDKILSFIHQIRSSDHKGTNVLVKGWHENNAMDD